VAHAGAPVFLHIVQKVGAPACGACGRTRFPAHCPKSRCARMWRMQAHLFSCTLSKK
jgi:hypothetical protein